MAITLWWRIINYALPYVLTELKLQGKVDAKYFG